MTRNLRVGVIGISAGGGWARESHVPAIRATDGLELVAVATRTQETADAAGAAFGIGRAYGNAGDLIADPDVDIVTVAAPVPAHHDLIVAAFEAGKHVITEWPVSALSLEKPETGMNLTTIQTAHTADFAIMLAGRLISLAVLTTIQYPELEAGDPPRSLRRVVPDHVLLHGRLAGGGALAVQVTGGRPPADSPFRMDVTGADGVLTLEGGASRGFQAGLLRLRLNGEPADAIDSQTAGLPAPVVNVAGVYAALRNDIAGGTSTAPDFGHAVRLSHLIDDIRAAATSGQTITPAAGWP